MKSYIRPFALALFAFVLFISNSVYSQQLPLPEWYTESFKQDVEEVWKTAMPLGLLLSVFSFSIAGLIYGIGLASNNNKIKNFGRAEMLQAAATTLMVAGFVTIVETLVLVSFPITIPQQGNEESIYFVKVGPFKYLDMKLATIQALAYKTYNATVHLLYPLYYIAGIDITTEELSKVFSLIGAPLKVAKVISLTSVISKMMVTFIFPIQDITEFMFDSILLLSFQRKILLFFSTVSLTVLLPLGVILRAFPPTRGAGGTLIALAYGFFFIYPLVYLAFFFPYSGQGSVADILLKNINIINAELDKINSDPLVNLVAHSSAFQLVGIVTAAVSLIEVLSKILLFINLFSNFYSTYFFVIQILPVLAGAMALTFASSLSKIFGEEAIGRARRQIGRVI